MESHARKQAIQQIQTRYNLICEHLDEKQRRLFVGSEAKTIGTGGITMVHEATAVGINTIRRGIEELGDPEAQASKVRKKGGGRKSNAEKDPELIQDINSIVSPATRGHPENPLLWSSKSTQNIADILNTNGHRASERLVARVLENQLGFSLQSNKKTKEGASHPDRDAQFNFINEKIIAFQKERQPVISIDAKKKENIGNFKNNGQVYEPKGQPTEVLTHDFPLKESEDRPAEASGKVAPYGIYDCTKNNGFVNVGISSDTAQFSVNSIRVWWNKVGKEAYPNAIKIALLADCGGSNSNRTRLWKTELQKLANEIGIEIHVVHFPPGTSKWNKIEHKMFCYISKNWRGRPLIDRATVINLIGNTKTKTGLTVQVHLDENTYETGIKVSDEELKTVNITPDAFHGEWNYVIIKNI